VVVILLAVFVVKRGNLTTPAPGTQIVGSPSVESTAGCIPGTPEVKVIYFGGDETATPYFNIWNGCDWYYKHNGTVAWIEGAGPTATPTPWVTWTPLPTPADVDLVNANPYAGVAEVENKTNVPIMFVDGTRAVHFDYFDPIKLEEHQKDLYPGRTNDQWAISCVVYPGERGYLLWWPSTFEDQKSTVFHYQVFGVPRPDLMAKQSYIHMSYQNLVWKINGNELNFSFDMEKFDGYALYQKHGVYDIMGTLFLYDKNGALIDILFHLLGLSDGGHIDGSTGKGPAQWGWLGGGSAAVYQIPINQVDHVRLLIEREEQPDCIRYPEKTYVFTPTPRSSSTPTVTPNPTQTST
jgi:hypothetical protein